MTTPSPAGTRIPRDGSSLVDWHGLTWTIVNGYACIAGKRTNGQALAIDNGKDGNDLLVLSPTGGFWWRAVILNMNSMKLQWTKLTTADPDPVVVPPPPSPAPSAPTITNATATPATLPAGGGSVTVNATVTNATSITVDGVVKTLPATVNVTASRSIAIVATGITAPAATVDLPVTVAVAPPPPPPPSGTESPDGTAIPPALSITDDKGDVWTIGPNQLVMKNGVATLWGWGATTLFWYGHQLYSIYSGVCYALDRTTGAYPVVADPRPTAPPPPPPPPPSQPPPVVAGQSTSLWTSTPDPLTVNFFDSRPVAQWSVPAYQHSDNAGKHIRGGYRVATGRVYMGGGDGILPGTGLADDSGGSSAQSVIYSIDAHSPASMTLEKHRYNLTSQGWAADSIQYAAADEGAMDWNTTTDRLVISPLSAFQTSTDAVYSGPSSTNRPRYVSATQFKLTGNQTATVQVGCTGRLYLDCSAIAFVNVTGNGYTLANMINNNQYYPGWVEIRITASSYDGTDTNVTFYRRPDLQSLPFTSDAWGLSLLFPPGDASTQVWTDFGQAWFRTSDSTYHVNLVEWNPTTRVHYRIEFTCGRYYTNGVAGAPIAATGTLVVSNGVFCPASVTNRGDEFISLSNSPYGAYHFEYSGLTFNSYSINPAPPNTNGGNPIDRSLGCLDTTRNCIWHYGAPTDSFYKYDIRNRVLYQVIVRVDSTRPFAETGDAGRCVYNSALDCVEVYADYPNGGSGLPCLFLIDCKVLDTNPADPTTAVIKYGELLPNGEHIRGNFWIRAGDCTMASGGIDTALSGTNTYNRHVFYGKNLKWQALTQVPHNRVVPFAGGGGNTGEQAATEAAAATLEASVPFREYGHLIIDANGIAYYRGGGHSSYQGSEVDVCDLNAIVGTAMSWHQNDWTGSFSDPNNTRRRSHLPPDSDGIYAFAGSSALITGTDGGVPWWQPTAPHMYAVNTAHPTLGLLMAYYGPTNLSQPANTYDSVPAIISWNRSTGKWTSHANFLTNIPYLAGGDWNPTLGRWIMFMGDGSADRLHVLDWSPAGGLVQDYDFKLPFSGFRNGRDDFHHWLHDDVYLLCYDNQLGDSTGNACSMYTYSYNSKTLTEITSASYRALWGGANNSTENVYACRDGDHQKMWWMVGGNAGSPVVMYYSTFADPSNIKRLPSVDNTSFRIPNSAIVGSGHKGMAYWNNYLWIPTDGGTNLVGGSGGQNGKARVTNFYRFPVF